MMRCLASVLSAALAGILLADPADELSGSFWVRFSDSPAAGSPTNGLVCAYGSDGRLSLRFLARQDEILGDWKVTTPQTVSADVWHHVAYSYSMMRRRAVLYLDGRWQGENANDALPHLSGTGTVDSVACEFADVRAHAFARESSQLVVVPRAETLERTSALIAALARIEGSSPTAAHRTWTSHLARRLSALAAREESAEHPSLTVAELEDLTRSVDSLGTYARVPKRALSNGFAVQVTEFPSLETVEPCGIPERGTFTDRMRLTLTPGERGTASLVIHAFRRLTNVTVSVSDLVATNGSRIASSCIDVSLVRRWFRPDASLGGSRRQRILVPGLVLHDADLVRVTETSARNCLRFDWPTGTAYEDCSEPDGEPPVWRDGFPVRDAASLRPVDIPRAGRTQQFLVSVDLDRDVAPGNYSAQVDVRTSRGVLPMLLQVTVLPFLLPPRAPEKFVLAPWNEWTPDALCRSADVRYPAQGAPIRSLGTEEMRSLRETARYFDCLARLDPTFSGRADDVLRVGVDLPLVRARLVRRILMAYADGAEDESSVRTADVTAVATSAKSPEDADAEKKLMLRLLTEHEPSALKKVYLELGELYGREAVRYSARPDPEKTKRAIAAYLGAFNQDPTDLDVASRLVGAYLQAKDCVGALGFLRKRLKDETLDERIGPLWGDCCYWSGDYAGALAHYEPFGPSLDPGARLPPDRRDRVAACYYALGRYRDCMDALERCGEGLDGKVRKTAARAHLKELIDSQFPTEDERCDIIAGQSKGEKESEEVSECE